MNVINRKYIHFGIFVMLINIGVTVFYSRIENPTANTFSMVGTRFDDIHNLYFIIWAVVFSATTFFLLRKIIIHFEQSSSRNIKLALHTSVLLVIITLIPARVDMPLLRWVHIVLSGVYVLMLTYTIHPLIRKTFRNSMMRIPIIVWLTLIWIGAIAIYFTYGHNSIYQIWFFINLPLLISSLYFRIFLLEIRDKETPKRIWTYENQPIHIVLLLLICIMLTLLYGNIENPNLYTLSMIGNLHDPTYFLLFIVWGLVYSLSMYSVMLILYKENNYVKIKEIWILLISILTLILTVMVPANPNYKVLHSVHIGLSILYIILFTIGIHPFIRHMTKGFKLIKAIYRVWIFLVWPGAVVLLFVFGNNGIYEMWFFVNVPLMMISLILLTSYRQKILYQKEKKILLK